MICYVLAAALALSLGVASVQAQGHPPQQELATADQPGYQPSAGGTNAMVNAEELGVSSQTIDQAMKSAKSGVRRLVEARYSARHQQPLDQRRYSIRTTNPLSVRIATRSR